MEIDDVMEFLVQKQLLYKVWIDIYNGTDTFNSIQTLVKSITKFFHQVAIHNVEIKNYT
jgi:hypothetical protein